MNIIFANDFNLIYGQYGIRQTHAEQTVRGRDAVDIIQIQSLPKLLVFSKRIELPRKRYDLVVEASQQTDDLIAVNFAYKIPIEIVGKSPLESLQNLANTVGLEMSFGGQKGKFFTKKSFQLNGFQQNIINPQDHSFITCFQFAKTESAIECAIAFCVDTTEYNDLLRRKGIL